MVRLVCLDVDGTLVDDQKRIPPQVLSALHRLQKQGIRVTLASGRLISSLESYASSIGTEMPLIGLNGAWVEKPGAPPWLRLPLQTEGLVPLIEHAETEGLHVSFYFADGIVLKKNPLEDETRLDFHWSLEKVRAEIVDNWPFSPRNNSLLMERPIMKLLVSGNPEAVAEFNAEHEAKYRSYYCFVQSNDKHLEIVSQDASKGEALRYPAYVVLDGQILRQLCWLHVRRDFIRVKEGLVSNP
ncbi:HAD-like domain protein [Acididesulfobacillus acetoxydans]|uniref:HAD-SF-IIB: HAD hydrolase, family IIB n=1 Tax=Acididesulfobacillus acetoxydans TaxID=1561005 RepID=A0A8S0X749_9FIRM|nr:HAD-IIB family hydrolase [Acididesulfobacillus acetoxydans]CAA7603020.1 HAD-like domain protein [Acididesulfobacillus acetoxydans]CEJ08616.1 HAD-SF-IIB: HAD hydrolase, family IIB [Acididesulfobacillus acetoxydans]